MKTLNPRLLEKIYFILATILILVIIFTPLLIRDDLYFVGEESLETIVIAFLMVSGIFLNFIYKREIKKQETSLEEAWRHIGEINLLVERYKQVFTDINKYPENKKDIKYLFGIMAEKILGIANCQYAMVRIIEMNNLNTLAEYLRHRSGEAGEEIVIGNKEIVNKQENGKFQIFVSSADNTNIKTFCILPKAKISDNQKIFIEKIIGDLTMLFIIFTSTYYKNSRG